jgi:murein DD-endopeptidase MepM/ murein hydrolase activator NlpD
MSCHVVLLSAFSATWVSEVAMRVTAATLIGLLAVAGCTNYVPLPQGGGSWEEARRAAYGGADRAGTGGPAAAATTKRATAAPVREPAAAPTTARDAPAVDALEPEPLPPLRTTSARSAPDGAPSTASGPAASGPAASGPTASAPARDRSPSSDRERVVARAQPAAPAPRPESVETPAATGADTSLPPPALSGVGFLWPVPAAGETATVVDVGGEGALAIQAPAGEPFVAAENGVVVFAGDDLEAFGRMVVVRHDGDYTTAYGHARRLDVAKGDVVRRGQKLGLVGISGEVGTPQLYFEMRVGSRVVDPRAYLVDAPRLVAGG